MRNIKLTIEYDGKDFNGWQKQEENIMKKTAEIVCERIHAEKQISKNGQQAVEEAVMDLAAEMNDYSIQLTAEQAKAKWGNSIPDVIAKLREHGFTVTRQMNTKRSGFLGLKKTKHWQYTISVLSTGGI